MSHARQLVIHGKHVVAEPDATGALFRVTVAMLPVCMIRKSKDPNFTHWHCGVCLAFTRDLDPMLWHVFEWHYDEASAALSEAILTNIAQLFGLTREQYRQAG